jgi:tetratricopeptide (TPR) repeat protein
MTEAPTTQQRRWQRWLPMALFTLAVLTCAISWAGKFAYDDYAIIVRDERVHSPSLWYQLWTRDYWNHPRGNNLSNWRPLASTTYALNWFLLGPHPWSFHVINTLIHGAVTLLVFALAREILRGPWPAAITAALFAVHPLHVEAVANVVGRAELMAALFALLAWRSHRHGRPVAAALFFALGVLSKETALPILGVLVLDDLLGRPGSPQAPQWRLRPWLGLAAVTLLYLAARWAVIGSIGANRGMARLVPLNPILADGTPLMAQWATAIKVLGWQWWLFLWPAHLSADYSWRQIPLSPSLLDPPAAAAALFLCALLFLALGSWRRWPAVTLGIGVWFLADLLTSNLIIKVGVLFAERLLYLPSVGMCLLVGALAAGALRPRARWAPRAVAVASGLILVAGFARSAKRTWDWGTGLRLWEHDVKVVPKACHAWTCLGIEYKHNAMPREAHIALRQAIDLSRATDAPDARPRHPLALESLAGLLLPMAEEADREGSHQYAAELREEIDRAIAHCLLLEPNNGEVLSYYAIRLLQKGEREEADRIFRRSVKVADRDVIALCNFGDYLWRIGQPREAIDPLERALREFPEARRPHELLAQIYSALGDPAAAEAHRREAARLSPDDE